MIKRWKGWLDVQEYSLDNDLVKPTLVIDWIDMSSKPYLMLFFGIVEDPVSWMGKDHIMTSLIIISVWEFFPFVVLSVLARMQTIPPTLYEAAQVDGAGPIRRFSM